PRLFCLAARRTPISALSLHDALPISLPYTFRINNSVNTMTLEKTQIDAFLASAEQAAKVIHEVAAQDGFIHIFSHLDADGISAADRKSTRLNSSHVKISYAVFCLKKK